MFYTLLALLHCSSRLAGDLYQAKKQINSGVEGLGTSKGFVKLQWLCDQHAVLVCLPNSSEWLVAATIKINKKDSVGKAFDLNSFEAPYSPANQPHNILIIKY